MAQRGGHVMPLCVGHCHLEDVGLLESDLGKQLGNLFLDVSHYI